MPPQITEPITRPQPIPRPRPKPGPEPQIQPIPAVRPKPVPRPRSKLSPTLQPQQPSPPPRSPSASTRSGASTRSDASTRSGASTRSDASIRSRVSPARQPGEPEQKFVTPSLTPQQPQFSTPNNEEVPSSVRSFRFFKPPTPETPSSPDPDPYVFDSFDNIVPSPWPNRRSRSVSEPATDFQDHSYEGTRPFYRNKTPLRFGSASSTPTFDDDESIYSEIQPLPNFGSPGPTVSPRSRRGSPKNSPSQFGSPSEDVEWSQRPLPLPPDRETYNSQYSATPPRSHYESSNIDSPFPTPPPPLTPLSPLQSPTLSTTEVPHYSFSPERPRTLKKTHSEILRHIRDWDRLMPNDPFVESEKVQFVNTDNFNELVASKDLAMVLFYDPDVAQSEVTRKYFKKAAEGRRYLNQQFAAVNCQVEEDFCTAHDATTLPMYKIFSKGKLLTTIRETTRFTDVDMNGYMDKLLEVTKSPLQPDPNMIFKKRNKCTLAKVFGFKK